MKVRKDEMVAALVRRFRDKPTEELRNIVLTHPRGGSDVLPDVLAAMTILRERGVMRGRRFIA